MEARIEIVNGKPHQVVERKEKLFIRIGTEIEVSAYEKGSRKAQLFGYNFSDLLRKLLEGFNNNFGIDDPQVKDPGSLFDSRISRHIQVAVRRAIEEITLCKVNKN